MHGARHGGLTRRDSYPHFPRSPIGTSGSINHHLARTHENKKKTVAFLESRSAKASWTNRPPSPWRYFTTNTRILQGFAFL